MNSSIDFDYLVETQSAEIFAYLWRMLRTTEDAEDCLQETFLRAFRAYHRLREGSNHRAWLYKIATNVARTHLKRRIQRSSQTVDLNPETIPNGKTTSHNNENSDILLEVLQAVEALPQKQRAALMMRKYQGLSYTEIAEALNCSQTAARSNVYHALKKLQTKFSENDDDKTESRT